MMQPKRTKYRKQFKGRNTGFANRGNFVAFGEFGLKATSRAAHDGARDRSGAARDGALRQARRPDLDPRVSGRADHARSRSRCAWAAARATSSTSRERCARARFCSRWKASMRRLREKRFASGAPKLSVSTSSFRDRFANGTRKNCGRNLPRSSEELLKLRREQFALRMQRATGQATKPELCIRQRRAQPSRLKTVAAEQQSPAR